MRSNRNVTALFGQGYRNFLDLLYPRRCPLCHRILRNSHQLICLDCAGDLRPVSGPRCYKCGKPVNGDEEYCRDCGAHPGAFDQGRGIFLYDDRMRYSIMKYKYFGCQEYSRFYGKALYIYGKDMLALWKPQIIIPVPLHRRKQRIRGFNQAEKIAMDLSKIVDIPTVDNISRKYNTKRLYKLGKEERINELKNAFVIKENIIDLKNKNVLLVDDIFTTGSTVNEISKILKINGVNKVFVSTFLTRTDTFYVKA